MRCGRCGFENAPNATICGQCRTALFPGAAPAATAPYPYPPPPYGYPAPQPQKSNVKIIVLIVALVVGIPALIAIVLAATVFVLVSDIGSEGGSYAPSVAFLVNEADDRIEVDAAASGADWNRLSVRVSDAPAGSRVYVGGGGNQHYNIPATMASRTELDAGNALRLAVSSDPLTASDYVEFCAGASGASNVVLRVYDVPTNTLIVEFRLMSIAAC